MRPTKRAAFSWFPKKKKAFSYRIAYDGRVPRITSSVCVEACMFVCIKFLGHVRQPYSAYATPRPVLTHPVDGKTTGNLFLCQFRCKLLGIRRDKCGNVISRPPTTGCGSFCDLTGIAGLRYICTSRACFSYAACCCMRDLFPGG